MRSYVATFQDAHGFRRNVVFEASNHQWATHIAVQRYARPTETIVRVLDVEHAAVAYETIESIGAQ